MRETSAKAGSIPLKDNTTALLELSLRELSIFRREKDTLSTKRLREIAGVCIRALEAAIKISLNDNNEYEELVRVIATQEEKRIIAGRRKGSLNLHRVQQTKSVLAFRVIKVAPRYLSTLLSLADGRIKPQKRPK